MVFALSPLGGPNWLTHSVEAFGFWERKDRKFCMKGLVYCPDCKENVEATRFYATSDRSEYFDSKHELYCSAKHEPSFNFHQRCGGIFRNMGKRESLECDRCRYRVAKTSKTFTAREEREAHIFYGTQEEMAHLYENEQELEDYLDNQWFPDVPDKEFLFHNLKREMEMKFVAVYRKQCRRMLDEAVELRVWSTLMHSNTAVAFKENLFRTQAKRRVVLRRVYRHRKPDACLFTNDSVIAENVHKLVAEASSRAFNFGELKEQLLHDKLVRELDSIVPKTTLRAALPKRRGGLRNRAKQNGLCYLKVVPKGKRAGAIQRLGYFPTIGSVSEMYLQNEIIPRHHKVQFWGAEGSHMVKAYGWPARLQWEILHVDHKARMIGSEEWTEEDEQIVDEFLSCIDHFEIPELRDCLDPYTSDDIALSAEHLCDEDKQQCDIASNAEVVEDVRVKGTGDCWKRVLEMRPLIDGGRIDVTASEFVAALELIIENQKDKNEADYGMRKWLPHCHQQAYKLEEQDGDWHIADRRNCFWKNGKKTYIEGYCDIIDLVIKVKTKLTRLVGSPAVSQLDKNMASAFSPDVRSAVEKMTQPLTRDAFDEAYKSCPWAVPESVQHKAEELKISWTKYAAIPHPHVIHAAMRRWCYMKALPKYINSDCTFIGMKPNHFEIVKSEVEALHPGKFKLFNVNPVVDLKDVSRYAGTETVPTDVWSIPKIETPMVFCDESGHYLSPRFMIKLGEDNPDLRCIGMSNIFPLLALEYETSPEPDFVDWRVVDCKGEKILIYIPEGDEGNKYEQPFDPTMTLLRRVENVEGTEVWNGGVVEKKGNLRLQMFYRYHLATPRFITETEYAMMPLPRLFRGQPSTAPVRVDTYIKLFQYAKVLPTSDPKNSWGKLRMFMRDEKIYSPIADQEWLVKVVLKAVQMSEAADLQSKAYYTLGEEIYYKTIGHLIRWKQVRTELKYKERNRRMVNNPDPVKVFPTLDAVVHADGDGSLYGVSWKLNTTIKHGFWRSFKHWINSKCDKHDLLKADWRVDYDADGNVIFPFLSATKYTLRTYGSDHVRDVQRRDFLQTYEGKIPIMARFEPKPHKVYFPKFIREEEPSDGSSFTTGRAESLPDLGETVSYLASETASSFKAEPTWEELKDTVAHCDTCPTFHQFIDSGGRPQPASYEEHCNLLHQAGEAPAPLRRAMLGLLERGTMARRAKWDKEAAPLGKLDNIDRFYHHQERRTHDPAIGKLRLEQEEHRRLEQLARQKPEYIGGVGTSAREQEAYDARKASFEKLYALKPSIATVAHLASGETLWDMLYNKTSDHRIHKIPWRNVVEFPTAEYPTNDCLLTALAKCCAKPPEEIYFRMLRAWERGVEAKGLSLDIKFIEPVALHYGVQIDVVGKDGSLVRKFGVKDARCRGVLEYHDGHIECLQRLSGLLIEPKQPRVLSSTPAVTRMMNRLNAWDLIEWHDWRPERKRANDYVKAIKDGEVSILADEVNMSMLEKWERTTDVEMPNFVSKKYTGVFGMPGCRKSSGAEAALKSKELRTLGQFTYILPTTVLKAAVKDKFDATAKDSRGKTMPGDMIVTLDRALAKNLSAKVIVMDENKFPKGYTALFHYLNPEAEYHIFLADPWQTSWHNPKGGMLNSPDIVGEAEYYMKYSKCYLVGTWRLPIQIANFWRMPTFSKKSGGWYFSDTMPSTYMDLKIHFPHLTDATVQKLWESRHEFYAAHYDTTWAEQLRQSEANSYAGSQGLEMPLAIVEVDERVLRGSDPRLVYTALTRSQYILIVRKFAINWQNDVNIACHPVFSQLEYYRKNYVPGKQVIIEHEHSVDISQSTFEYPAGMKLMLAGPPAKLNNWDFAKRYWEDRLQGHVDPDAKKAGARLRYDEDAYIDRPDFHPFINELEEIMEEEEYQPPEPVNHERKLNIALPVEDLETFKEFHSAQVLERFDAELVERNEYSEQFVDLPKLRKDYVEQMRKMVLTTEGRNRSDKWRNLLRQLRDGKEDKRFTEDPIRHWAMFQSSKDNISFIAARRKRLRLSTVEENKQQLKDQAALGNLCWDSFKRYLGWNNPVEFDELFFHKCVIAFQERRGERSQAMKKASLNRADPDYGILITAKTQMKLKERIFKPASALQPVFVHADEYLFKFGPYGIYLLEMILKAKPEYWNFYAKQTPEDLEAWVAKYMPVGQMFDMNDQTGQDQATQGWAVVFFKQLMQHFMLPEDIVEAFEQDKITKVAFNHIMAIMTDSGEIWTYLINTTSSAARECAIFGIPPGLPMTNGGDDTMRSSVGLVETYEYSQVRHLDPCEDKRYSSQRGDFVSFIVKNGRLCKDPIILLKRLLVKIAVGDIENAFPGYFILWKQNYEKAEILADIFDEEEMSAHQLTTRLFFNLKRQEHLKRSIDWSKLRIDGEVHEVTSKAFMFEEGPIYDQVQRVADNPDSAPTFKKMEDVLVPLWDD